MNKMILNIQNLDFNLRYLKSKTNRKICAVVKANAYGHGMQEIVKALSKKVDLFACANLDEAILLRNVDKQTPTLVLFDCQDFDLAIKNNLSVCIHTFDQIKLLTKKHKNLKVHIAFNSGMNRFGFCDFKSFKKAFAMLGKKCNIEGIYTHFNTICSDNQTYKEQIKLFEIIEQFAKRKNKNIVSHTGGSHDIFNKNFDMIRIGLFLYGYGLEKLKPVMKIISPVLQLNNLKKGQSCGYDKEYIADQDCTVATVPIGYQDGIKKYFLGQKCFLGNQICPIVAICMDCIMIKVPPKTKVGDEICVFYDADLCKDQLNYEVLTGFNGFRGTRIVE